MRQVISTATAFAELKIDGSVVTWGRADAGGDSVAVAPQLSFGVSQVFSNGTAFMAVKQDGPVITWGHSLYGGSSGPSRLLNVVTVADPFTDERLMEQTVIPMVSLTLSPASSMKRARRI